jgi:carboxypeptidase Taq
MFPGYQLGTLMAAQLYDHLQVETPDLSQRLEAGDFSRVRGFLQQKIHQYGGLYSMQELVELSTGKPLSCNGFTKLLRSRYL